MARDGININNVSDDFCVDIPSLLKTDTGVSEQVLAIYIPDRDQFGVEIGNQRKWILEAARLFTEIGGGASMQSIEGVWTNSDGNIIWEKTVKIYTFIHQPDKFMEMINDIKIFINRFGKETNQGEVFIEFDGQGFKKFDFDE